MEELEKKLLLEIKGLLSKLEQEPTKTFQLSGGIYYKDNPDGDMYCYNAQLISDKIVQLKNECKSDYIDDMLIHHLDCTLKDEVYCVGRAYKEAIKPKAAKKRWEELRNYMYDATQHIRRDIYNVIDKISKI